MAAHKLPVRTRGAPNKPFAMRKMKSPTTTKPLLPGQILFVQRYVIHRNAARAYRESHPDCSAATARSAGSKMLADYRILKQINELLAEIGAKYFTSAERTIAELALLGHANVQDFLDDNGIVKSPKDFDREAMAAVKKFEVEETYGPPDEDGNQTLKVSRTTKIEIHDKTPPLRALGSHYNLFVDTLIVHDGDRVLEAINDARQRLIKG